MSTAAPWGAAASGGRTAPKVYTAASNGGICADLATPPLTLGDPGQGPQLTFWTKHDLDYDPTGEIFGTEGSLGQAEIATGPVVYVVDPHSACPELPGAGPVPFNNCATTQTPTNYFTGTNLTYTTYTASLGNWAEATSSSASTSPAI
jgi:hypothetical protein